MSVTARAREAPARASGSRRVLAFAFSLSVVTYLDRVCIATAAPFIMDELHVTVLQMSVVFSMFTLAYSLFEIPSGWLGDVIGPRRVLTRIVLWWSAFTMLTGAVTSRAMLMVVRFLFGAGEAGAFPNMARALSHWFPARERGRANSVLFFGSRVGGMLSAPIAVLLIERAGWRASFLGFGLLGVVWTVFWQRWFSDYPPEGSGRLLATSSGLQATGSDQRASATHDASRAPSHRRVPWRQLAASRNMQAICLMYFAYGYGLYFYFTWLPTYLTSVLKLSSTGSWIFSGLPFLLAGLANLAGGWTTDHLAHARGLYVARSVLGCAGFLTCAALVCGAAIAPQPIAKALLLAFALGAVDFSLGACWAVCLDIGADHAGVVTGAMNTVGNIGGVLMPIVAGFIVERSQSWTMVFYVTAAVYLCGALSWIVIDPLTPLSS